MSIYENRRIYFLLPRRKHEMRINHNISALNTYRQLSMNETAQNKTMEQLSSGKRINRAADDAVGFSISRKMENQIRGLEQAQRNAQDGISLAQTAQGGMDQIHDMLSRIRELVVQSNNGTNGAEEKQAMQQEISQLSSGINAVAQGTQFNGQTLLTGTVGVKAAGTGTAEAALTTDGVSIDVSNAKSGLTFTFTVDTTTPGANTIKLDDGQGNSQTLTVADATKFSGTLDFDKMGVKISTTTNSPVGGVDLNADANAKTIDTTGSQMNLQVGANSNQSLGVQINDMQASALGTSTLKISAIDVTNSSQSFNNQLAAVDAAISQVNTESSKMGALQNRLEYTNNNLGTQDENLTAANSRITDVDMAKAVMENSKNGILAQAAQAMLAQANQQPQSVLQLLRG
jgi:flagellin